MIQLTPQMRIFVFPERVDFRNGLDGLLGIVKRRIKEDPFSGAMFLFRNRKRTAFKAIVYDGQGFWLFMKRLSEGKFNYWPKSSGDTTHVQMLSRELSVLIWNGDPKRVLMREDWKSICTRIEPHDEINPS
jgi:transposase